MDFSLKGKTALVTGGSRGLGKAIALAYAESGANVAIVSRTESELKKAATEIEQFGTTCYYEAVDVQNRKEMESFVKHVVDQTKSIDILVNAAGINRRYDFMDFPEEEWHKVINTNLNSVFTVSQVVIPYMQKQQYGKIINIASLTSEIAFPRMAAYAASKGAISQLTKSLAVELADDGILVNAIGPGYFKTELTAPLFEDKEKVAWMKSRIPLKRIGVPEELQGTAVFLASQASDYITGQTIYVDGGWLIG